MRRHEYFMLAWAGVLLGVLLLVFESVATFAMAPRAEAPAPAFYRQMLGAFEVTVLWDGTTARQFDLIMSKPAVIRDTYARDHQALPAEMSINTFLINTGSKLVLVDTGGGGYVGPRAGRLLANLRAAGYLPEQVDAILITHMHPDHIGGLMDGERRVFPNAVIHFDRRDLDYWLGPAPEGTPAARKAMFDRARASVGPYSAAGMLRPFLGVTELYPGIRALPAPGHTMGHTAYRIESQGKVLLLWGDIVHSPETQFSDPEISIQFDTSPDVAIETRKKLFAELARSGDLVGSAHITFPGLGHVGTDGKVYNWVPLPYGAL